MRKLFRHLHLWISVPFGLIVVVMCFTGALLVFEKDITDAVMSKRIAVEPLGKPLPVKMLADKVSATLADGVKVTGVTVSSNAGEAYKVGISKPRHAAVYVNQYTGEVLCEYQRLPFFRTTMRMHRWLMDSNPGKEGIFWGKIIVGVSTIAFVLLLITGIAVWLPRNGKMLKNRLKIVASKGKNRFWYDLHVAGGFYAFVLLLAMALTGLTWSFDWYSKGFYAMFAGEDAATKKEVASDKGNKKGGIADDVRSAGVDVWQVALDAVVSRNPDFGQATVSDGTVTLRRGSSWGNYRASDKYIYNKANGEIESVVLYKDSDKRSKARGWVYTIHTGLWGGMFSKLLTFFAALLGASLPLTGYYFWIKRLYGKRKRKG